VAITDRIRAAGRWAFTSERPAALSLAETKPRADTTEYGSNSVSYAASKDGPARLIDPEYKWQLRGRQGGTMYRRMRWSDPHIWGLRQAQNLAMLQAQATMEPAPGGVKNAQGVVENPDALAKAELADRLLLNEFPWRSFLQDSLLDIDYGFSCFEIVWRIENGEAKCRLALRPSSSIWVENIYVKDGAIDHVVQNPIDGGERTIPGEKIVWFAHQKEGDSFTGRSIMRPMYKPWSIKEELEIELAILVRKGGGVPDIETDDEPDNETAAKLDAMGRRFGLTPDAFFRHTVETRVSLLAGNVNVGDVLEAIKERNSEITSVCQAQVFDLGTSNAGSRALGTTLSDLFANGIQADAKAREDVLNARGGLVHQLIAANFPRDDNLPKLRFGAVQAVDLNKFAQALLWLSQAFPGLPPELQEWVRSETGMPESTAEQVVVDAQKVPDAAAKTVPPQPSADGTQPPEGGAQASEAPHSHAGLQLSELRPPRGVECYLNLAELVGRFDDAKTAIREATQGTRDALVAELGRRARTAADKGQLAKFAAGAPPMIDKLAAEISAVLSDFYAAGQAQVVDELKRQKAGKPWSPDDVGTRIVAAEKPKVSPQRLAKDAAIAQQAEMAARSIALVTQAAAANAAARATSGVPLAEAAMADAILRESDATALRFAGVVSDLMQLGRADEAQAQAQQIEDAVYSALLDGATCAACEPMDGETTTDLTLAEGWTPNPDCLGGERCRCLVVYEIRQEPAGPTLAELTLAEIAKLVERPIPAPVVNVAAPPAPVVNVAAPVVNVAAAEAPVVTVNVPDPKPRRVSRKTAFITDESGRIVGKTETEE